MHGVWHVLFGTFRWMAVTGVLLGAAGAYVFWEDRARIRTIEARGVEAAATLIQLRAQEDSNHRKTYWADVKWRDADGALHQRTRIPVSGTFARRVLKDGRLAERATRIKYLPDAPDTRPLILDDTARNSYVVPAMMWLSLGFAVFAAFGWVHMLNFERRSARAKGGEAALAHPKSVF